MTKAVHFASDRIILVSYRGGLSTDTLGSRLLKRVYGFVKRDATPEMFTTTECSHDSGGGEGTLRQVGHLCSKAPCPPVRLLPLDGDVVLALLRRVQKMGLRLRVENHFP